MLRNRRILFLVLTVLLFIVLPVFIFLVQKTQENRSRASAGTSVKLEIVADPTKPTRTVGDPIQLVMSVDPGTQNLVSVVSFQVTYDKTKVTPNTQNPFTRDPSLSGAWQAVSPVTIDSTNGVISGTFTVSSDPTQALQKPTTFGTFAFTAIASTEGQVTTIGFSNKTAIYSLASSDTATENVLTTATPAQFSIASTPLPTVTPTPTGSPVCLDVITYAVNDTTGECKQYATSCIPSGWHTVNACPEPSPGVSATPTISPTVKIQGHIVDATGTDLTLPGTEIRIYTYDPTNPTIGTQVATLTSSPVWSTTLPRDNYRIQAIAPQGSTYTITSSICSECTFHPDYNNGYSVTEEFANNPQITYVDIYYKFTPQPTPTIVNDTAYLAINLGLHGIGYAGDSASPGHQVSFSPTNPAPADAPAQPNHTTRDASIQFYDQQNQLLYSIPATLQFSTSTYTFGTIFQLSSETKAAIGGKTVGIRISIPKYLTIFYPLTTIKNVGTTNLPYSPVVTGNVYNDTTNQNQLDILDYNAIMDCRDDVDQINKTNACSVDADLNDDGVVNVLDYNLFIRELSVQNGR